jgi:hypothetical protein
VWLAVGVLSAWFNPAPAFGAFDTATAPSGTFSTLTLLSPPALTATLNGSKQHCEATLTWTLPQPGVPDSWSIQRYSGANASGNAQTVAGSTTTFVDVDVSLNTTYTWKIRALLGSSWTSATTTSPSEAVSNQCR